ncbi:MAG: rod shape-determining protein [Peptoniphilaceae bacterium]|nr:rod shape-determining protein [Peptoniphilaceae bacterium]MDD7383323.1 rod shape-determining protein [Peptoniphilaceae bacterium]MDY3738306.1 rod shape-determining protein [Peptoniphilaceae bacterium]
MNKFRVFATDIAIDLGTANILVYKRKEGIIANEPSVIAIEEKSGEIKAIGKEAKEMIGKTGTQVRALRPIENGVISNFDMTQALLSYFFKLANPGISIFQPRAVIAVPSGITDVQRRAVEDAVLQADCRDVILVEESLASAFGMNIDAEKPKGNLVLNSGAGTTEVALISMSTIVYGKTIKKGGDTIDKNIINYIRDNKGILIGKNDSEEIKLKIASLKLSRADDTAIVYGRSLKTGDPTSVEIRTAEILDCVLPYLDEVVDTVKEVLENTPPELSSDIRKRGIFLTGGSCLLDGFKEYISQNTRLKVTVADDPLTVAINGAGYILNNLNIFLKESK